MGSVFYKWDLSKETGRVYDVYNAPALQKGGLKDPPATPSQVSHTHWWLGYLSQDGVAC